MARVAPAPHAARQERRAKDSFETKRWRAELARWEGEWKPALIAANLAAGSIDLAGLDDAALADHLEEVHTRLIESGTLHFRLHVSDMGPLGDLMVHLEDWGLDRESRVPSPGRGVARDPRAGPPAPRGG